MNYQVAVSESGDYIVVRVSGDITSEIARNFSLDADQAGSEHGLKRYLFDMTRATNVESILRNYQYAYEDMAEMDLDRSARSAVLVSPQDRSHDFVETVATNAGYNVRLFTDEAVAVAWLAGRDPSR